MTQIIDHHGFPVDRDQQHQLGLDFLDLDYMSTSNDMDPQTIVEDLEEAANEEYEICLSYDIELPERRIFVAQYIADNL